MAPWPLLLGVTVISAQGKGNDLWNKIRKLGIYLLSQYWASIANNSYLVLESSLCAKALQYTVQILSNLILAQWSKAKASIIPIFLYLNKFSCKKIKYIFKVS